MEMSEQKKWCCRLFGHRWRSPVDRLRVCRRCEARQNSVRVVIPEYRYWCNGVEVQIGGVNRDIWFDATPSISGSLRDESNSRS